MSDATALTFLYSFGGTLAPVPSLALGICSALFYSDASLVYRIRSVVADECREDEWLANVLTQAANRIERMNRGLMLIKSGGGTPEERRAYCQEAGISTADADGMARAAIASPNVEMSHARRTTGDVER